MTERGRETRYQSQVETLRQQLWIFFFFTWLWHRNSSRLVRILDIKKRTKKISIQCIVHAQSLQSCPTVCDSMDYGPPVSSVHAIPDTGIEPMSPTLQVDSLPTEPPGKLMHTSIYHLSVATISILQTHLYIQIHTHTHRHINTSHHYCYSKNHLLS